MALEVGQVVEGKVTGITHFGAFVELSTGQTGLVHISEVADEYVRNVGDYLKENDIVKVKILNMENNRVGLSIRQAQPGGGGRHGSFARRQARQSFEDKLARFMKDSDERQSDIRRSTESKRGGRGGGRSPSF
ncbi:MAG: S1 RNA-binding domain-containing protein [Patescibacteria group bacterium]